MSQDNPLYTTESRDDRSAEWIACAKVFAAALKERLNNDGAVRALEAFRRVMKGESKQ